MLEIAKEDIVARLAFDNPWWDTNSKRKIPFEDQPRRGYFASFQDILTDTSLRRAVVLMGPRRVGKTVMVYQSIKTLLDAGVNAQNIFYVSLETPIYTGLPLEKLLSHFQEKFDHGRDAELYVYFDEVQYLPSWEIHLKSLVDSYPSYRFIATGSAAAALRLKSQESGAGRFTDYVLPPLTFAEYLHFIGRDAELIERTVLNDLPLGKAHFTAKNIDELNAEFVNYLNYGGYPEAVFSPTVRTDPSQYIKSDIIDKVLLRDLPSLYGISDIQELNRLFTTLAYNSGNEVSLNDLSKTSGVAKNTINRYMEYLEAAFLIRRVERIDQNAKRFKRASAFKVYLNNPSMRAALFGSITAESPAMGALTETAIYSQWQHNQQAELFYARWNSGEVDIVHMAGSDLKPNWAVEVKWTDRPYQSRGELDNCVEFAQKHPNISSPMLVTSRTISDALVSYKGMNFEFCPSSVYAYTVGVNLVHRLNLRSPKIRT
jgi:uncharacterized protein